MLCQLPQLLGVYHAVPGEVPGLVPAGESALRGDHIHHHSHCGWLGRFGVRALGPPTQADQGAVLRHGFDSVGSALAQCARILRTHSVGQLCHALVEARTCFRSQRPFQSCGAVGPGPYPHIAAPLSLFAFTDGIGVHLTHRSIDGVDDPLP